MTELNKFWFSSLAIGLLWPYFIPSAHAVELNLYAGPQSITPREMIHVTVLSGGQKTAIELSYISDDGEEIRTGTTEQGLISFEVPAQKTIGQMRFTVKAGPVVSNTALVSVLAGPPQNFTLSIKQGMQAGTVDISSGIITDQFGNSISDLTLASLDWIDERGLNASHNVQLTQGRIILGRKCPSEFEGPLTLRAAVSFAEYISTDISSLCREETQKDAR